jgi:hypothetical protein
MHDLNGTERPLLGGPFDGDAARVMVRPYAWPCSTQGAEVRVSALELSFDLVFVFTITQLASLLARHVDAPLPVAPAFVLAGGVASYLLSNTLFRWTMHIQRSWYRVAAAIVALMTTALGTFVAGIVELVGILATVVMMLVLEARYR